MSSLPRVLLIALVALCVSVRGNQVSEIDLFESTFSRHLLATQFYCDKVVFGSKLIGGKIIATKKMVDAPLSTMMTICCDACTKATNKKCRHFSIQPAKEDGKYDCQLRTADAIVTKCGANCNNESGNGGTSLDFFTGAITVSKCSSSPGKADATYTYENRKGPVFKGLKIHYTAFKVLNGVVSSDACWRECVSNFNKGGYNPVDRCRSFNFNGNFKDCYLLNLEVAKNPNPKNVKYCQDPAFYTGYHDAA